jgi:hypothetical protein
MSGKPSAVSTIGGRTTASLLIAVAAFIVELLWLEQLLPMTSDQGQLLIGALVLAWIIVSLGALLSQPRWILAIGVPLALFGPVLVIGGILFSCAVLADCP